MTFQTNRILPSTVDGARNYMDGHKMDGMLKRAHAPIDLAAHRAAWASAKAKYEKQGEGWDGKEKEAV